MFVISRPWSSAFALSSNTCGHTDSDDKECVVWCCLITLLRRPTQRSSTTDCRRVPGRLPVCCLLLHLSQTNWTAGFVGGFHSVAVHGHGELNLNVLRYVETSGTSHPVVRRHIPKVRRPLRITVIVTICCTPDNIKLDCDAMMNGLYSARRQLRCEKLGTSDLPVSDPRTRERALKRPYADVKEHRSKSSRFSRDSNGFMGFD